jgi:hypothetical protein
MGKLKDQTIKEKNQNTRELRKKINKSGLDWRDKAELRQANRKLNRAEKAETWANAGVMSNWNKKRQERLLKNAERKAKAGGKSLEELQYLRNNPSAFSPKSTGEQMQDIVTGLEETMPLSFDAQGNPLGRQRRLEEQIKEASLEAQRGAANRAQTQGRSRGGAVERQLSEMKLGEGKAIADSRAAAQEADFAKRAQLANTKLGLLQNVPEQDTSVNPILNLLGLGIPNTVTGQIDQAANAQQHNINFSGSRGGGRESEQVTMGKGMPAPESLKPRGDQQPPVRGQIPNASPTPSPAQITGNSLGRAQMMQSPLQQRVTAMSGGPRTRLLDRLRRR